MVVVMMIVDFSSTIALSLSYDMSLRLLLPGLVDGRLDLVRLWIDENIPSEGGACGASYWSTRTKIFS